MAITDILNVTPQLVAEQNPELHQMRKIAFGENYLQDIEQGTGTSQYYSGWGNVPNWAQTSEQLTDPTTLPHQTSGVGPTMLDVAGPDAGIMSVAPSGVGSMPTVPAGGMEGGVWGPMDYLQPPLDQAGAVAAMTQPEAYNIPGTMPLTPVSGAWGPMDYLQQPQTIVQDPMAGDAAVAEAIAAQDRQEQAIQAPEPTYPIAGLSTEQKQLYNQLGVSNLIDPDNVGKDKYGKNIITGADTLGILGNTYEEGVREYVEKYGDKKYKETSTLANEKQKDYKALVDAWDERDAVTGILPPSRLSPEEIEEAIVPKTYAEKTEDIYRNIEIIEPRPGITLYHNTETGVTGDNIEDVIEKPEPIVTEVVAPPVYTRDWSSPAAGGNGGVNGGYSGDPGGGTAGSPFAKGGRVGYKKGGIVDLL